MVDMMHRRLIPLITLVCNAAASDCWTAVRVFPNAGVIVAATSNPKRRRPSRYQAPNPSRTPYRLRECEQFRIQIRLIDARAGIPRRAYKLKPSAALPDQVGRAAPSVHSEHRARSLQPSA
ncbi:unnamed protein product, partial [Iphiclides podalirius]